MPRSRRLGVAVAVVAHAAGTAALPRSARAFPCPTCSFLVERRWAPYSKWLLLRLVSVLLTAWYRYC